MRVCIFAEGSYPHILGGVSSWINNFIKAFPDTEFVIMAIGAESRNRGQFKYELPDNVVEVKEVFLDEIRRENSRRKISYDLTPKQKEALSGLIGGVSISWPTVFHLFGQKPFKQAADFFMSKEFFNIIQEVYRRDYPYTPFNEFIWTMRSMYLTLFHLLMQDIPEADLYHTVSTGYAGVLGAFAKHLTNRPLIVSEHGIYTREREEEIIKADWVKGYYKDMWIKYFYNFSSCAYESADRVTSLFSLNRELQIDIGCPPEKIEVIPNGVTPEAYAGLDQAKEEDCLYIGAIVRVVPIKDIKTMLRAFSVVNDSGVKAKFYVMGPIDENRDYFEECVDMARYLKLDNLEFTGTIDIRKYIGKMDMLVLTSISEGQPFSIIEGMAAGKPYVATNVGDCRGLVMGPEDHYGPAGFIEYVMDYEGIGNSIIRLCHDEALRTEMGQNGRRRVESRFRLDDVLESYRILYENVAGQNSAGNS